MCKLCLFNKTRQIKTIFSQQEKIQLLLFWLSMPKLPVFGIFLINVKKFQQINLAVCQPGMLNNIENPGTRQTDKFSIIFTNWALLK